MYAWTWKISIMLERNKQEKVSEEISLCLSGGFSRVNLNNSIYSLKCTNQAPSTPLLSHTLSPLRRKRELEKRVAPKSNCIFPPPIFIGSDGRYAEIPHGARVDRPDQTAKHQSVTVVPATRVVVSDRRRTAAHDILVCMHHLVQKNLPHQHLGVEN